MPPEEVLDREAQTDAAVPPGPGAKEDKSETITLPKAELESLLRQRDEALFDARYYARAHKPADPAPEPAEELNAADFLDPEAVDGLEGDTPEKLVDDLAAKGAAGLKQRGFVTESDVQRLAVPIAIKIAREIIGKERTKDKSDNLITTDFADLQNPESELFKVTKPIYQKAVAMDPSAAKTPAALYLAAQAAQAIINGRKPAPPADESEEDRQARVEAQNGRRTKGRSETGGEEALGPQARQIIADMKISEAEFRASQKQLGSARRSR